MSFTGIATTVALEDVSIEQIQVGDWVVSRRKAPPRDLSLWQVHRRGFKWNQTDGGLIMLRSKAASGEGSGAVSATPGTPISRATFVPTTAHANAPDERDDNESNYRHRKCYANTRGGCSTKISGEHYISECLIALYTLDDPSVKIRHDTGFGVREFVSPKQFKTNILCERHNNHLHSADDAALRVATFVRDIALRFLNGAGDWGGDEEITVSGEHFQSWVLKLILNHAVGKAFNGQRIEFPPEAVDVLLGRAMWPRTWGLCVAGDPSNDELRFNPFSRWEDSTTEWCSFQSLMHRDGWVGGGIVHLNGIGFGLTVFNPSRDNPDAFDNNPDNPLRGSIQRPRFIAWELGGVTKRINFEWQDVWEHKTITYKMATTVD